LHLVCCSLRINPLILITANAAVYRENVADVQITLAVKMQCLCVTGGGGDIYIYIYMYREHLAVNLYIILYLLTYSMVQSPS